MATHATLAGERGVSRRMADGRAEEEGVPVVLTKYEAAELVASRALLLAQGATPRLTEEERDGHRLRHDVVRTACLELQLGRLDARILRGADEDGRDPATATVIDVRDALLPDSVHHLLALRQ